MPKAAKKVPAVPAQGIPSISKVLRDAMEPESEHVRLCKEDLEYFIEHVIRDQFGNFLRLTPAHRELCRILTGRRRGLIFLPRGFGKSTIGLAYICWKVGLNRDLRILIASKGADLAEERMRIIETILKYDEYQEIFGDMIPAPREQIWTATEKIVTGRSKHASHSTFYAVGIGGQAAGHRSDIVFCDDVIDQKNAMTDVQRGHASAWFWKEVFPVLEPVTGQTIVLATPWSHNDLYSEIKSTWGNDDEANFEFLHVKALIKKPDPAHEGEEVWVSIWPERFPTNELLAYRKARPLEFTSQMMCEPIDTTFSFLQGNWLRVVEVGSDELPSLEYVRDHWMIYFGIDPSWSGRKQADQFACVVGAVNPDTLKGYIVASAHDQLSPTDANNMVLSMDSFWHPMLVNFEENAAQVFLKEQMIANTSLNVNGVKAVGPKEERFKAMSVHFTSGRFALAGQRDSDGELRVLPELEPLVYEWITFPNGEHDDILDGLEKLLLAAAFGGVPVESGISQDQVDAARAAQRQSADLPRCLACKKPAGRLHYTEDGIALCANCMIIRQRNMETRSQNSLRGGGGLPYSLRMN